MSTVEVNGVVFGINSFGNEEDPLVLLIGGTTMLSWPDAFCEALAAGGRHAVRYDLRDSGDSTAGNPMKPAYDLRDLAADTATLAAHLDDRPAHLAGIGVSGMVAQVAALDHPGSFDALTLVGTRPVAPGPVDDDLPDHDQATMGKLFSRPMPDWMDREAVARHSAEGSQILGNDHQTAKVLAGRIWDRTAGSTPEVHMANQIGIVFSKLDCTPRWRERLPELEMPTLVIHGAKDPFFPVGNGEALVREIPNASLLVLENASTVIPPSDFGEVAAAMLQL
ncbi:alpha/beta fold hydrolase [Glutamicibacter sp. MCAF14]|uniref:alpha/beta fold hydrolase n=1 Tax=Glutamicibacter sp. MCAF14 TaxID=3233043 RepID=UPI003F900957